jgi:hypothetical protein
MKSPLRRLWGGVGTHRLHRVSRGHNLTAFDIKGEADAQSLRLSCHLVAPCASLCLAYGCSALADKSFTVALCEIPWRLTLTFDS